MHALNNTPCICPARIGGGCLGRKEGFQYKDSHKIGTWGKKITNVHFVYVRKCLN